MTLVDPRPTTRLRAAFLCDGDITSVATWSGTPYHIYQALAQHFEVALAVKQPWIGGYHALGRVLRIGSARRFDHSRSSRMNRIAARATVAAVRRARPDVVFAVSATGLAETLIDAFPVVNCADATPRGLFSLSKDFLTVPPGVRRAADRIDAHVLGKALFSVYASDWARLSAIKDYGADPDRVLAVPFGANAQWASSAARPAPAGEIRMLFVGKDWERKGGCVAVATVIALRALGHAVRLDIAGVDARTVGSVPDGVVVHGMLHKDKPEEAALLASLYANATFFLMPTHAECYGIVFAEAAQMALPSIAYGNGGVPTVVMDGVTGLLLPPAAGPQRFAAAITGVLSDPARYTAMSRAALEDARTRLNWTVWSQRVAQEVQRRLTPASRG